MRVALPMSAAGVAARASRLHQLLDLRLDLVGQLEPVGGEDLDAVVLVGIVRRADHHARVGTHGRGDEGDARGRQRPHQHDVGPGRDDPGLERALQHVAREPGVLADDDAAPSTRSGELARHRTAQTQSHLGGHGWLVGHPPDPVRAE